LDAAGPVEMRVRLGEKEGSIGAIDEVKKAIPICVRDYLTRLPGYFKVDQYRYFIRIPVVSIRRSELEMPSQPTGICL
jgi:hypothetical protein